MEPTVTVYETMTGDKCLDITAAVVSKSWPCRLNGQGRGRFVIKLARISKDPAVTGTLFKERARMIGVHDGTAVGHVGVIIDSDWDEATGLLTLETYELRTYWTWRMTAGVNNIYAGDLKATGLSASGYVRHVVQRSMQWDGWQLPIDLPGDGSGGWVLDVDWFDFRYIEDIIQDLERTGYEVLLEPYLTETGVRFRTRVEIPITSGEMDLPASTMKTAIPSIKVKRSSSRQVTGVLALGNGSGTDSLIAWQGDFAAEGIPVSDVVRNEPDVKRPVTLQGVADNEFAENRRPTEQWSFPIMLDDVVTLTRIRLGRILHLDVRGSVRIPDGRYLMRVIALTGGDTNKITLEVQSYGS